MWRGFNLVNGAWRNDCAAQMHVVDPLNGERFIEQPHTSVDELAPFVASLAQVPKSGVFNVFKRPEMFLLWGDVNAKLASELAKPEVERFFCRLIQRVMPKSYTQARNEVVVTRKFLENFSGDQVRFLARSFGVAGDHAGQMSTGHRWPYGPVAIIAPFNFPLEIPVLQLMGALYMGNKPLVKPSENVSIVVEQWARFMHACGAPLDAFDLIHCQGRVMGELLARAPLRMTQFTGSSRVAELLARQLAGRIKIEDAGFDWKVLGPDVPADAALRRHVAWQCDQDAYAASGQKCSAQSILFAHDNWLRAGLLDDLECRAAQRKLDDLTIGPVLTHTTQGILEHAARLAAIPGARVLFGAHELKQHTIPKQYGAVAPTAVFVPLAELVKPAHFELCTTEIFGPFQVVTSYGDADTGRVIEALERMHHHLTAAIVSNDATFINRFLGSSVNGTTYAGLLARTTAAPQNHWFGPAGDPRGAGIGSPEAIKLVWSCHREVIYDWGPIPPTAGKLS
jgi:1-pyrroline-5-carboxylate dehydrogenase